MSLSTSSSEHSITLRERTARSLLWVVAGLCVGAAIRPNLGPRAERGGLDPAVFWQRKLQAKDADVVFAGDSRTYRGISLSPFRAAGVRPVNYGFSGVGFEARYLARVERLLAADGARVIVLGLTTHSLTARAARENGFLSRDSRRWMPEWWLGVNLRFDRISLSALPGRLVAATRSRTYYEEYRDGWVRTDSDPRDPNYAIRDYEERLKGNQVDPGMVRSVLAQVALWRADGIRVVGFRFPLGDELREVEDGIGGMKWDTFANDFRDAGGEWLQVDTYQTYDGAHLTGEEAERFSVNLAGVLFPSRRD